MSERHESDRRPSKCDYCDDPVCLDDFITGECPAEESVEDCGCVVIRDTQTGEILETVEKCAQCAQEDDLFHAEDGQVRRLSDYDTRF